MLSLEQKGRSVKYEADEQRLRLARVSQHTHTASLLSSDLTQVSRLAGCVLINSIPTVQIGHQSDEQKNKLCHLTLFGFPSYTLHNVSRSHSCVIHMYVFIRLHLTRFLLILFTNF